MGCCFNGFSYVNPPNNDNVSECICSRDVFGYTHVGTLCYGSCAFPIVIWKKYGNYYWTYSHNPDSPDEFKLVYYDSDYGYYYIYNDEKEYLKKISNSELVRNIEQDAYTY